MRLIVDFAYTGTVSVTEDNVKELLIAADEFNMIAIVQTCCTFLTEQLRPENCVGIWQFTRNYYVPRLQLEAYHYILYHFEDVAASHELRWLSVQDLCDILDRDYLIVKKENTVFQAVLHWIAHAPRERGRNLAVLLARVSRRSSLICIRGTFCLSTSTKNLSTLLQVQGLSTDGFGPQI